MKILMQFVKDSEYYQTLNKEIIKMSSLPENHFDTVYNFKDQDVKIEGGKGINTTARINNVDIKDYSKIFIYNLGKNKVNLYLANILSIIADANNTKVTNTQELYSFRTGKILEKILLSLNSLPTPRFYFANPMPKYNEVKEKLGERFVAKQSKSNFGKKVILINNEEEFNKLELEHDSDNEGLWFFEEFVAHQFSTRGIVTGLQVETAIKVQKEKDTFKTNHGEATFYKNEDKEFETLCVKAAQLMKLELAGVDTVTSEGETLILEINKSPGITVNPPSLEIQQIANYLKS